MFSLISVMAVTLSIPVTGTSMKTTKPSSRRALVLTLALACLPYAKATGWALTEDSLVLPNNVWVDADLTPDIQIVREQAFKSYFATTGGSAPYT